MEILKKHFIKAQRELIGEGIFNVKGPGKPEYIELSEKGKIEVAKLKILLELY